MESTLKKENESSLPLLDGKEIFISDEKEKKKEEKEEEKLPPKVSIIKLWAFASCFDICLIIIGSVVSIIAGLGFPLMSIIIGDISGSFINVTRLKDEPDSLVDLGNNETIPFSFTYSMYDFKESVIENCYRYLYIGIIMFFSTATQVLCFLISSENMIHRMRKSFFKAVLHQDISWFDQNNSGTLTSKMFDNLERVKEGTGDKVGMLLQSLAQFISGFAIAFVYDWKLTLIMMSLAPVMLACGLFMSKFIAKITASESEKVAKASAIAEEALTSMRTVVAFNGVKNECDRYEKALEAVKKAGIIKSLYAGIGLLAIFIIIFGSYALAFWIGVDFVADGSVKPETILIVFFCVMMGSMALGGVGVHFSTLGKARGSAAAIFEIIERQPEIDSYSPDGIKPDKLIGKISLKDVKFSYPSRPEIDILKGISFEVQPGQTIALVGSSGCGKSTIMQLLLRYYNPSSGTILIDDIEISNLNIEFLRKQIGLVSQEPILFDCSIEENIKFGNPNINDQELRAACRLANIENFISQLPEGYMTVVGERGVQLSGGQKQRIAIARALVKDPKILLLDEATSALDAESEHIVQQALEKAKTNRTTIIIAHRLSTIKNADKIIALKNGEIIESGTHKELIQKKGFYYDLVNAQVFTDIKEEVPTRVSYARQASTFSTKSARSPSVSTPRNPFIRMISIDQEVNIKKIEKENQEDEQSEKERLREELEKEGGKRQGFRKILLYARPEWKYLILALLASALSGFVFLAFSLFFTQIIEVFSITDTDKLKHEGHFWALMFVAIGIFQGTTMFLSIFFFGLTSERMTKRLRSNLFKNIMRMDIAYFDMPQHSSGKISTRLATDTPNVKTAIDSGLGGVVQAIVSLILGIIFSFYYGWQMALVMLAIFPLAGLGQWLEVKYFENRHEKDKKENENAGHLALEAIENIRTVQSLTLEKEFFQKFSKFLEIPHKTSIIKAIMQGLTYAFGSSITYFLYAISFRFGLYLIENGSLEPMNVMKVLFAMSFTTGSIGWAASYFPEYTKARLAAGIIFKMLGEKSKIDSLMDDGQRPFINGTIELKDVQFAYYERPESIILKGLDLTIKQGQTLAIVGPSGCGKSTVISLLERFYDPFGGEILIDGNNLREMNVSHVRSQIALVSQEPILFDCSIKENITYGYDPTFFTMNQIKQACKIVNIDNFIENNLSEGYETRVGEKGVQLSGGQKQRIAIARALIRNPKILLLDEATSALDAESEKIVQEALDRASQSRTCIIIAHRLSTIVNADCIVVMKNGVVIEQGTHTELINKRGAYYELTKTQNMASH